MQREPKGGWKFLGFMHQHKHQEGRCDVKATDDTMQSLRQQRKVIPQGWEGKSERGTNKLKYSTFLFAFSQEFHNFNRERFLEEEFDGKFLGGKCITIKEEYFILRIPKFILISMLHWRKILQGNFNHAVLLLKG